MEILGAVLLTMFLSALDQTIVGTALPRIVTELTGNELYVWVVTIYLLTATVSGPIYGKLSDLFGRRPMMMIGVSLFLLGSLLCALSQEMWQLIVFRGSRVSARAPSSRSRWRSSATCSARASAASTRASSAPSSPWPRSSARRSAAS